jgi:hypothetical protein
VRLFTTGRVIGRHAAITLKADAPESPTIAQKPVPVVFALVDEVLAIDPPIEMNRKRSRPTAARSRRRPGRRRTMIAWSQHISEREGFVQFLIHVRGRGRREWRGSDIDAGRGNRGCVGIIVDGEKIAMRDARRRYVQVPLFAQVCREDRGERLMRL